MYTLRRWWDRHGLHVALVGLTVSAALFVRYTQGAAIFEVYQVVTRPFQSEPTSQEQLTNAKVAELEQRVVELEAQNQKLKKLLDYVSDQKQEGIVAPVVGRSADHWWRQVIIGRGSEEGIQKNYIVTSPGGVVGRVMEVTPHTSRVLLISDPSSRLGVTISRSRFMGVMRGKAANRAVVEFFDKVPDVKTGDVVATSSYSRIFPSGLSVGRVESVDLNKSPAPEAVIELSAPLSSLEWVVVYPHQETDELPPLEGTPEQPEREQG
ncbi:rod shape-determining protein MreC [Oxynema sp. CENA135]|uniref:rod shape-determining protein MreC n=1 Tax=Oxynema sp. CENA135 TaxID=984206 RepID=UPI00190D442F|nr:rod shape-determining protein MreC [Oxynema sp. CENA135]MBK4730127.1 rod shape-determining protein MreC [Oxynema sp. CENA135]